MDRLRALWPINHLKVTQTQKVAQRRFTKWIYISIVSKATYLWEDPSRILNTEPVLFELFELLQL